MNRICLEKHKSIYVFLFVYIIAPLVVAGCKKAPKLSDPTVYMLKKWSSRELGPEGKENLSHAINTYKNKTVDPVPILIEAVLSQAIGYEQIRLVLRILDEDKDLLGFVIREESQDPNGTITRFEEDYAAFARYPGVGVATIYGFDISARKGEYRKDKKDWNDHLADERVITEYELWKSSLPTIYISIPDSDKINVRIHVYDKTGNISNTVELVDHTRKGR